jgi:excisionase family DNA binding protein
MVDQMLYRVPEVARALNISRTKVYELIGEEALPWVRIDGTRLVRASDLQAYVESLPVAV